MTLKYFNQLGTQEAQAELFKCCGCTAWAETLAESMPFDSISAIKAASDKIWSSCLQSDILEAFSHHPKIGDVKSLTEKFTATKQWASGEQAAVSSAPKEVIENLAKGNKEYEQKFGYIFIVCATGKSAEEMLEMLNKRLLNAPEQEIRIAAKEQNKITHLRIEKLFA